MSYDLSDAKVYRKTATAKAKQFMMPFRVETPEGVMTGDAGDYVLEGPAGEQWPVKREIFEATYVENKPGVVFSDEVFTPDHYQEACLRTAGSDNGDRLLYTALGIAGEAGEYIDMIKKSVFHHHALDHAKIGEELGDLCWYIAVAASVNQHSLSNVMRNNIDKLRERYPGGFSTEKSVNRKR